MNLQSIYLSCLVFVCSVLASLAQVPPTFFSGFPGGFQGFSGLAPQQQTPGGIGSGMVPTPGNGRANTGPILFPPSPESRDTSGVVVGASGYGFIPPGVRELVQGRALSAPASFSSSFGQAFPNSPYFTTL